MDQAHQNITPEIMERLQSQGLKPYKQEQISDALNPHKTSYWVTNGLLTATALFGRHVAGKNHSLRYLWSTVVVAIPLFAIGAKVKLEGVFSYGGHRRTLEEKLDYSPITRRAWYRALEENNKYQSEIIKEIQGYELRLIKRKLKE